MTTANQSALSGDLPALPKQVGHLHSDGDFCQDRAISIGGWPVDLFTDYQMREYATEAVRAALAARGAPAPELTWQDIATAPRDGTGIDLWTPMNGRVADVQWLNNDRRKGWHRWGTDDFESPGWEPVGNATHWMPKPADPAPLPMAAGSTQAKD